MGLDLPNMMQRPSELGMIIACVEGNLGRFPVSVLEIGVWQGGTLARFRRRWPGAVVVGVDPLPFGGEAGAGIEGCEIVVGRSQDEATRERVLELLPEPVEFVHIDGSHVYEDARADYEWARDVLQARMIALHDVAPWENPELEVWRLWHEIKLSGIPAVEIRHDPNVTYGYGLVLARG
jgi:hypothetical protein